MGYALGLDLGTTFTAAAVHRNGRAEVVSLGNRASVIPSLVFLREDEEILVGDAAERRGLSDPRRLAREFKRRLGDSAPIMLGSSPYSAERIMGALMRDVVGRISELEGEPPEAVAITHPANWGPYKTDLLRQAADLAGLRDAAMLTEPLAAALHYASTERVEPGSTIAVYDLGGGTFDATVLRKTDHGFQQLGDPEGIERLGGIDFDEAVFRHVCDSLGAAFNDLDHDDPAVRSALQRLRAECTEAKEALSSDTDAIVPVMLPGLQTDIRITRGEFEAMVRPTLRETVEALRRALDSAGVTPADLRAVLLVGGSSRIPLVAEMVSNELGRPVAVDAHPKHAVALGAALVAADIAFPGAMASGGESSPSSSSASSRQPASAAVITRDDIDAVSASPPAASAPATPVPAPPPAPPTPPAAPAPATPGPEPAVPVAASSPAAPVPPAGAPPGDPGGRGGGQPPAGGRSGGSGAKVGLAVGIGVLVLVVVVALVFVLTRDDGTPVAASSTTTTAASEPSTSATTEGSTTPECTSGSGRCAFITGIRLEDGTWIVDYTTDGYDPVIYVPGEKGTADDHHVHFYFDTVAEQDAGTNGSGAGAWEVWDRERGGGELVFDAFSPSNMADYRGEGATQVCAIVADSSHAVELGTGNCVDLPMP